MQTLIDQQKRELIRLRAETSEVLKVLDMEKGRLSDTRVAQSSVDRTKTIKEQELLNLLKQIDLEQKTFALVQSQTNELKKWIFDIERKKKELEETLPPYFEQVKKLGEKIESMESAISSLSVSIVEKNKELSIINTELLTKTKELQIINENIQSKLPILEQKERELLAKEHHIEDWERRVNKLYSDKLKNHVKD